MIIVEGFKVCVGVIRGVAILGWHIVRTELCCCDD